MRTLMQIIDAAKANEPLDVREARYAICAMSALEYFDGNALSKLCTAEEEKQKPFLTRSAIWQYEEHFKRWKKALAVSPEVYVGHSFNPENEDYQQQRIASLKLFDKISAKMEAEDAARTQPKPTP